MKEILVVSGKGGTGKTSITAALASLCKNIVLADCDVDASDLHLVLSPKVLEEHDFISGHEAVINQDKCINCGMCFNVCKFDAVKFNDIGEFYIDATACEGCGVCTWMCPKGTIEFPEALCGKWFSSETRFGPMIHAKLEIAAENSGKLVSVVRNQAKQKAVSKDKDVILIDGPPGIGCPVIASMTGADCVVLVTEPTLSAIHDMERVVKLAKHFKVEVFVCINKCDINDELTEKIEMKMKELNIEVIGKIPYDKNITEAQIKKQSIIEYLEGGTSAEIVKMYEKLKKILRI